MRTILGGGFVQFTVVGIYAFWQLYHIALTLPSTPQPLALASNSWHTKNVFRRPRPVPHIVCPHILTPATLRKAQQVEYWWVSVVRRVPTRTLIRNRIQLALRKRGACIFDPKKEPPHLRVNLALGMVSWRMKRQTTRWTGIVRWPERFNRRVAGRFRAHYRFRLHRDHHKGPRYNTKRQRIMPDVWFLMFPHGGTLVLPASIIPHYWKQIRIHQNEPNHWIWKYWERWDILTTLPNLPDDLVWHESMPTSEAEGDDVALSLQGVVHLDRNVESEQAIVG